MLLTYTFMLRLQHSCHDFFVGTLLHAYKPLFGIYFILWSLLLTIDLQCCYSEFDKKVYLYAFKLVAIVSNTCNNNLL